MERGEGLTARRRFLMDMAWPVSSDLLCHMFGLIDASTEVREAEKEDSQERMQRLADDDELMHLIVHAAADAGAVLALVETADERTAWLTTYGMALLNLLESREKVVLT